MYSIRNSSDVSAGSEGLIWAAAPIAAVTTSAAKIPVCRVIAAWLARPARIPPRSVRKTTGALTLDPGRCTQDDTDTRQSFNLIYPPAHMSRSPGVSRPTRAVIGALVRLGLTVYFRRIERFHLERVPLDGPVLFVSNHPGSVTDAFIIASGIPRIVHFVATVRLFKIKWLAALLTRCGIVPINRKQDDPAAMKTVADTFAHCYRVFEDGGAIGIFPEGVSYNDEQMRPVKTGAARMSLEVEDRHNGGLGLRIAPVGLTYSAKGRYRQDVLAHFGEPFAAAEWLAQYRTNHAEAVRALTATIEQRIRALIVSLPSLEHQRIVDSVKRLYLDRLRLGNLLITEPTPRRAEELVLSQAIAQALAHFESHEPERLAAFVVELKKYEGRLELAGLSDPEVKALAPGGRPRGPRWLRAILLVLGAPVAAFGWVHRLAPVWFIEWAIAKFSPKENVIAQVAHASMVAGLVAFGVLYATAAGAVWYLAGWQWAAVYLVSLPLTGIFAHHYLGMFRSFAGEVRALRVLARLPLTRVHLARMRARLIAEIESFRADYRRDVLKMGEPAL